MAKRLLRVLGFRRDDLGLRTCIALNAVLALAVMCLASSVAGRLGSGTPASTAWIFVATTVLMVVPCRLLVAHLLWPELRTARPVMRAIAITVAFGLGFVVANNFAVGSLMRVADAGTVALVLLAVGLLAFGGSWQPAPAAVPPSSPRRGRGLAVFAVFLFAVIAVLVSALFVSNERIVYHWDLSNYWEISGRVVDAFRQSPMAAWDLVSHTVRHDDYSFLPVVPLLPITLMLGDARWVFVAAVTAVYGVLAVLMISRWIAMPCLRPAGGGAWRAFVPFAVVLLCPWFFAPAFRGYPAPGGVAIALAAIGTYFSCSQQALRGRQLVVLGLLLALTFLYRRWFAFWIVAFFAVMSLDALAVFVRRRQWNVPGVVRALRPVLVTGTVAVLTLVLLAWPLVHRVIATDYGDVYSGYQFGEFSQHITALVGRFGYFYLGAIVLCAAALMVVPATRRAALLLIVQPVVVFLYFTRTQYHGLHHWTLYLPAALSLVSLAVVHGLAAVRRPLLRGLLVAALLGAGTVLTICMFCPGAISLQQALTPAVPRLTEYPAVRDDVEELKRLCHRIDVELAEPASGPAAAAGVYVLASSGWLSDDILRNAGHSLGIHFAGASHLLLTSHIDKIHGFPRALLQAELVCVADPAQTHLINPSDQLVVLEPARSLLGGTDVGKAFTRLAGTYSLQNGITVHLFRRTRAIEPDELAELSRRLRAAYPDRPRVYSPNE